MKEVKEKKGWDLLPMPSGLTVQYSIPRLLVHFVLFICPAIVQFLSFPHKKDSQKSKGRLTISFSRSTFPTYVI